MTQFPEFYECNYHMIELPAFQTFKKFSQNQFEHKKQSKTRPPQYQGQVFQSRSRKKSIQISEDVSFENTILDNHFLAFKQIFNKYWQKINNNLYFNNFKVQEQIIITLGKFNYKQWLTNQLRNSQKFSLNQINQIIQDWGNQQNLSKFLRVITSALQAELNSLLNSQILYLTSLIWEQYLKFSCSKFSDQQILKRMLDFLTKNNQRIFSMKQFQHLTFTSQQVKGQVVESAFIEFLNSYAEIIYLVIEGYFDNPLISQKSENSFNKALDRNIDWSDFQDFQLMGLPRKMPKLN